MDYATLSELLGGTVFSEEYRGNPREIASRCTSQGITSPPGSTSSIEERHSATLLRAVYLIFTGNLSEAQGHLERLLGEDGLSSRFAARCRVYLFHLVCVKRLPPVLRFRSSLDDSAGHLADSELQLRERIQELERARQELSAMETLESTLLGNMLAFSTALHISFVSHPQHTPSLTPGGPTGLNPFADNIGDLSSRLGLRATKLYLDRLTTELHLARGSPESQVRLDQLHDSYDTAGDLNGVANCLLIKADNIVSPPFTSPLAMGLIAVTMGEGWSNDTWDAAEPAILLRDDRHAQDLYRQASFFFEAAECPRGSAAVLLRRGCIQHAVGLLAASQTERTAMNAFMEAGTFISRAGELFEGDVVNSMLVRCHQLLLAVSVRKIGELGNVMGLQLDPFAAATDLGRRAHDTGNTGTAAFMGTLILRFGRWRFVSSRDVTLALVCCACSRALFAGAGETYLELNALIAHANLLHQSGDMARAEVKVTEGRGPGGLLERVLERISLVCDKTDSESDSGTGGISSQNLLRFNTLKSFDLVASRIYQATSNSVRLNEWRSERDQLTPSGAGTAEQEMERLFDGFAAIALGPNPSQQTQANNDRAAIVDRMLQPIISQEQLALDYNNTMSQVYAALDRADVGTWQDCLRHFVWRCDHAANPNLQTDQIAIFKLIALSQLGALNEARAVLPGALPRQFADAMSTGHTTSPDMLEAHAPPVVAMWCRRQKLDAADRAISYCILAQDWARGAQVVSKAVDTLPEFFNNPHSLPRTSYSWQTLTFVAMIYEHNEQARRALEWYLCALDQLEGLRNAVDVEARRGCHSSIHSGELLAGLTRLCLAFDGGSSSPVSPHAGLPQQWGLPGRTWTEQALIFLERGRSRALLDLLVTKDNLDPKKVEEWAKWAYEGHLLVGMAAQQGNDIGILSYEEVAQRLRGQRGGRGVDIPAIQNQEDVLAALSRLEAEQLAAGSMFSFAEPAPTAESLFECIPQDTIVFEMNSSRQGLVMLGITHEGVVARYQSGLTDIQLRTLVLNFSSIVRESKGTAEDRGELDRIAAEISKEIVDPIKHRMLEKDVVVFAPSHVMQLFPCSALALDGDPLFLHKIVYHIPSLSILRHLSIRQPPTAAGDNGRVGVLASSAAAGANMTVREAIQERNAIPMIGPEAVMIADAFRTNPTDLAGCDTDKLRSIFGQSDIVHLATHGTAIFGSPWQSYLDTEPPFRVLDLAALTACARLVVFGCCWSGAGSANPGNDVVGFTHATLASGAQAYIGGLWKTADLASMLLMVLFYREIARSQEGGEDGGRRVRLAEAWRNAQVALYHSDMASVRALLVEAKDLWRDKVQSEETRFLERFQYSEKMLNSFLRLYSRQSTVVDFKHPAMWAPYILVGCGDVVFGPQ
ncbi:CHAT domain-containing protein [Plectosphaerella plurivora]|uniref:CHAT domain-containing protein n=1 Tax=Plectosphaerella plurivora TaxID=936078 RepID=A0A9P8VLS7_9PEZI|nr:CHAT domain-containing protein [Plectosphaerella plurivora]